MASKMDKYFEHLYAEEIAAEMMEEFDAEKHGAAEHRRALKKTAKKANARKTVAETEGLKLEVDKKGDVIMGRLTNHAPYTHIDFNSDGSYCQNRIDSKQSKGEISGWKQPTKRSKTFSMADINTMVEEELHAEKKEREFLHKLEIKYHRQDALSAISLAASKAVLETENEWNVLFSNLGTFPV